MRMLHLSLAAGLAAGCAHRPPALLPDHLEAVARFSIQRGELSLLGTAIVVVEGEHTRMAALSPMGTTIFSVDAVPGRAQVQAPDPRWARQLGRIPFNRDLLLVYGWSCSQARCRAGAGTITEEDREGVTWRRFRGPHGPARARISAANAVVTDPLRRYTLTLLWSGDEATR